MSVGCPPDLPWEERPFESSAAATPLAGFVVKVVSNGQRHYLNMCSHPTLQRPLDARECQVSEEHLQLRGVDNLRVPLLTGAARTHVLPRGEGEAICVDVVFCVEVIRIALVVPPEEGSKTSSVPPPSPHAVQMGKVRETKFGHRLPAVICVLPRSLFVSA